MRSARDAVNESTGFLYSLQNEGKFFSLPCRAIWLQYLFPNDEFCSFCDTFQYSVQSHLYVETQIRDSHSALFPAGIHMKQLRPVKTKRFTISADLPSQEFLRKTKSDKEMGGKCKEWKVRITGNKPVQMRGDCSGNVILERDGSVRKEPESSRLA